MTSIEFLRQQLRSQESFLSSTGKAIEELAEAIEQEQLYTRQLTQKASATSQVEVTTQKEKPLSKVEEIAQMTDNQLLAVMGNPKKVAQLLKGL